MTIQQKIHIIAGPTASGKSARALSLAQKMNGVIINADATQLYEELQVLSARPDAEELQQAPHRLYGVISGSSAHSVADWLALASQEVRSAWENGQLPIFCGGTGMYLKALMEGLSPIPDIPSDIREESQQLLDTLGNEAFHQQVTEIDPEAAARIPAGNRQRLIRAYEVWKGTGKPLSEWQKIPKEPPFPKVHFDTEIISLPREELYARCDARFEIMLQQGAIEEVEQLLEKAYCPTLPIMKAVGVPELASYLRGESSLEKATALAQQNTRRYAKRQLTWLRHQMPSH